MEGIVAPVQVRHHPGARRLTLRVSKTRKSVVMTVPERCRLDEASKFLRTHIDWVRERLGRVPEPVPFANARQIPFRGQMHRICFTGPARGMAVVSIDTRTQTTPRLNVAGHADHAARRLKDWLVAKAKDDLEACVGRHAKTLGVRARRITLRDQTSRWGSCSAGGVLSFSWRLILAPSFVLDYVAAHEVGHLVEMNHGTRFWKLVARCVPQMDEARQWLRQHGSDLHRYGAEVSSRKREL
ncbi:MAG TPA: SprT family zinc-dependent metalloprotease [Hyphomicrobiaceae bacterium]|nr:SprT family zinc-dependent metalloprotease [Hyphomicrobiaceae bacterium]